MAEFVLEEKYKNLTVEEYLIEKNKELIEVVSQMVNEDIEKFRENAESKKQNLIKIIDQECS